VDEYSGGSLRPGIVLNPPTFVKILCTFYCRNFLAGVVCTKVKFTLPPAH
jgi:hypothetical protein